MPECAIDPFARRDEQCHIGEIDAALNLRARHGLPGTGRGPRQRAPWVVPTAPIAVKGYLVLSYRRRMAESRRDEMRLRRGCGLASETCQRFIELPMAIEQRKIPSRENQAVGHDPRSSGLWQIQPTRRSTSINQPKLCSRTTINRATVDSLPRGQLPTRPWALRERKYLPAGASLCSGVGSLPPIVASKRAS